MRTRTEVMGTAAEVIEKSPRRKGRAKRAIKTAASMRVFLRGSVLTSSLPSRSELWSGEKTSARSMKSHREKRKTDAYAPALAFILKRRWRPRASGR